jgi:hypothetical protein
MNEAGAVLFGVAVIVALAFLWVRQFQREREVRAVQGQRIMKSLRDALLRENSAEPSRNVGIFKKPSAIPDPAARGVLPSHGVELSLVLYSPHH